VGCIALQNENMLGNSLAMGVYVVYIGWQLFGKFYPNIGGLGWHLFWKFYHFYVGAKSSSPSAIGGCIGGATAKPNRTGTEYIPILGAQS